MAPAGEYHTPNATFGTTVGPPPRSSASRASSPLSVSLPSLSLTRFFPLEFCQAFRLPPSHYSRFLFSLLFSISIDVFFGRSFSRLFLFTHHLSSLVLQLSFSLSLSFHPLLALSLSFIRLAHLHSLSPVVSSIARYPVALFSYRNSQSSLDLNAGREATTLFAATTLKGDDGVHQLSARPYRSRRMPRGFAKGLVPSDFHRDEKEISLFPLARSTCSSMCELDERTKRTRQRYHAWEGEEGGGERAPLYVCLSVYPSVYLSVRPSVCRSV